MERDQIGDREDDGTTFNSEEHIINQHFSYANTFCRTRALHRVAVVARDAE